LIRLEKKLETIKRTKTRYYRVDRRQIAFIKFIFEAYDGMAVLTTMDTAKGIIALHIAPCCQEQVLEILQNLKKEVMIQTLTPLVSVKN
jgi:hypothetical protein